MHFVLKFKIAEKFRAFIRYTPIIALSILIEHEPESIGSNFLQVHTNVVLFS